MPGQWSIRGSPLPGVIQETGSRQEGLRNVGVVQETTPPPSTQVRVIIQA